MIMAAGEVPTLFDLCYARVLELCCSSTACPDEVSFQQLPEETCLALFEVRYGKQWHI